MPAVTEDESEAKPIIDLLTDTSEFKAANGAVVWSDCTQVLVVVGLG